MPGSPAPLPHLVLHIGMGKTGTSSLQAWLRLNRQRLLADGVLYPEAPGLPRHTRLGLAAQPDTGRRSLDWRGQEVSTAAELRPLLVSRLREEVLGSGAHTVVMSDEALIGLAPGSIRTLRGILAEVASSVRVVVYLRRQDDHLCSRYQQVVKYAGMVRRLAERPAAMSSAPLYDYHARLSDWRDELAPAELVVRRFEPAGFVGGSLQQDFLAASGLEVDAGSLEDAPSQNESLDADSVEFLRLLNLLRREHPEAAADLPRSRRVVRRLQSVSNGPVLTLPDRQLDDFMAHWEETNRAVAAEHLPDGPAALFSTGRRTTGTTTEQRLDPARVETLAEVAGLPASVRGPLAAIAGREAARAPDEA